jgi:hypothetical protein
MVWQDKGSGREKQRGGRKSHSHHSETHTLTEKVEIVLENISILDV